MNRKPGKGIVRSLFLGLWVIAAGSRLAGEIPQAAELLLTSRPNGTTVEAAFPCSGVIYAYLTFPRTQRGAHLLEGVWTGPQGRVVRRSRGEVDLPPSGGRTAGLWFAFPERTRSWDVFALRDPPRADQPTYDGEWELLVLWDGQTFSRSTFTVHCP